MQALPLLRFRVAALAPPPQVLSLSPSTQFAPQRGPLPLLHRTTNSVLYICVGPLCLIQILPGTCILRLHHLTNTPRSAQFVTMSHSLPPSSLPPSSPARRSKRPSLAHHRRMQSKRHVCSVYLARPGHTGIHFLCRLEHGYCVAGE